MKKVTINNNALEVNAIAFVIPNRASLVTDYTLESYQKRYTKEAQTLCDLNGKTYDPTKDRLIQLWYASDDLGSENLSDHGFILEDQDGIRWMGRIPSSLMPAPILNGHVEGDVIDITYPVTVEQLNGSDEDLDTTKEIELRMHVTLEQTKHRYRRFGTFEQCLQYVQR